MQYSRQASYNGHAPVCGCCTGCLLRSRTRLGLASLGSSSPCHPQAGVCRCSAACASCCSPCRRQAGVCCRSCRFAGIDSCSASRRFTGLCSHCAGCCCALCIVGTLRLLRRGRGRLRLGAGRRRGAGQRTGRRRQPSCVPIQVILEVVFEPAWESMGGGWGLGAEDLKQHTCRRSRRCSRQVPPDHSRCSMPGATHPPSNHMKAGVT